MKSSQLKVSRELTFTYRVRHRYDTVHGRLSVETTDEVGEVIEDGQVVLDGNDVAIWGQKLANDLSGLQSLLDIEIRRRFVEHVAVILVRAPVLGREITWTYTSAFCTQDIAMANRCSSPPDN